MSLKPESIGGIPAETARIAKVVFGKGNVYMKMRDELGVVYVDEDFSGLYPHRGQPALSPCRLALITVMQFMENLTDRQAAEAVRARIDWKYCLGLELEDRGFDYSVLSEFRERLVEGQQEKLLLEKLLGLLKNKGMIKARGEQRTDSTHVVAAIRSMNRLEQVAETMRAALNELANLAPEWLKGIAQMEWYKRYAVRVDEYRLPKSVDARKKYAEEVGRDGFVLLDALKTSELPSTIKDCAKVEILRQQWARNYERKSGGQVRWRAGPELSPAAQTIESPYDPDARYCSKNQRSWIGYKVHFSETCEKAELHVITNVHTVPATDPDVHNTSVIHQQLADKQLLPDIHFVDSGFIDAELLVSSSKEHGITLFGPPLDPKGWQSQIKGAYTIYDFQLDWDSQVATCPQGKASCSWKAFCRLDRGKLRNLIQIRFSRTDCLPCAARERCFRNQNARQLTIQPKETFQTLHTARLRIQSDQGQLLYHRRAGIEGTFSQGIHITGLRRSRYQGLAKTHLQHVAIASAINILRTINFLDHKPHAQVKPSSFARLQA